MSLRFLHTLDLFGLYEQGGDLLVSSVLESSGQPTERQGSKNGLM